jgi:hypothetical protein
LKEYLKQLAHMANLPELAARVKELEKRADDPSI